MDKACTWLEIEDSCYLLIASLCRWHRRCKKTTWLTWLL